MTLSIAIERPTTPDAAALIAGSEAAMRAFYDTATCSTASLSDLDRDTVDFFVARMQDRAIGCVALDKTGSTAEVLRLYVADTARGQGTARALIATLENHAIEQGVATLRLKTGDKLAAAVALYRALGYKDCAAPDGDAPDSALLFMTKSLKAAP